jgi:hypothetical protein
MKYSIVNFSGNSSKPLICHRAFRFKSKKEPILAEKFTNNYFHESNYKILLNVKSLLT